MKNFLKSKTMIFSMVLVLVPQILSMLTPEQFEAWGIGNEHVLSLIGVVVGWLRMVTTKALSEK